MKIINTFIQNKFIQKFFIKTFFAAVKRYCNYFEHNFLKILAGR